MTSTDLDITSQLSLGEPTLDKDHLELHRLVEQLQASASAQRIESLDALASHAGRHFADEDQDLRQMGGEATQCHLDEHAAVLNSLADVRAALTQAPPEPVQADMVLRLCQEFFRWLPEHVQVMDAVVAQQRAQSRWGGAPVLIKKKPG